MELLSLSGYIFASLAYFIFILLLVAARNTRISGHLVLLGGLFTLASFATATWQLKQGFSLKFVFIFEAFKLLNWALLILATREHISSFMQFIANRQIRKSVFICLLLNVICWGLTFYIGTGTKYLFVLFLALNLWILVLLEQLYRNADVRSRWALWPMVIALGATCVFDFVMFAQAAMLNQLDFGLWFGRSVVAVLGMPLLLVSIRRMKDWSVNVFISRGVVFYSSMLLIASLYLLLMALAGYVINYFGGQWGNVITLVFLIIGGLVLAVLLITEKLRKEVRVFITKHFFANKYDYRIEWLKLIEQLEISPSGHYYKTALSIIRSSLGIPFGAIVKKTSFANYQTLYSDGIVINQALIEQLCHIDKYSENNAWIIDLREYTSIENSYPGLVLDPSAFINLKIGIIVPIIIGELLYGFFILSLPKKESRMLNWEDRDLMKAISKQLGHYLSLHEANEHIAQSKQFDAFNQMSAFLVHDIKNVQAQLTLINTNAQRHRNNPDFIDDVFETIALATSRLDKMLNQLRNKQAAKIDKEKISVNHSLEKMRAQSNVRLPKVTLSLDADIDLVVEAAAFYVVINHLVQNAQEATNDSGWVNVKTSFVDDQLQITISDNGCGMSDQFIKSRLFKPFDTTKGNAGMGIGVFEAKQFIENLAGSIKVTSVEGKGTKFTLILPICNELNLEGNDNG